MAETEITQANDQPGWIAAILDVATTSPWVLIDQDMVTRFAQLTDDEQYIHVDPQRAASTPFGGTIAHGFLLVSLLTKMQESAFAPGMPALAMGLNYGFERVRFIAPFPVGSRARGHFKVVDVTDKGDGRYQITTDVEVEREGADKPAMSAQWLTQIFPA